jgi:ribosome-binding factor A
MKSFQRTDRIAALIRNAMAELFLFEARDPRVKQAVVTGVKVTADVSIARIYVRSLNNDAQGRLELLRALAKSKVFLRHALVNKVNLLRAPNLEFYYDETPDEASHIEELLAKLRTDGVAGEAPAPAADEPDEKK